jgi:hypothetical protein
MVGAEGNIGKEGGIITLVGGDALPHGDGEVGFPPFPRVDLLGGFMLRYL